MKIAKIKIENFRSCKNLDLNLQNFNALIGYNNAGKSNCLKAIKYALLPSAKLTIADFFDEKKAVKVEVSFDEVSERLIEENPKLVESAKTKCAPFFHESHLKIRKIVDPSDLKKPYYELFNFKTNEWENNKTGFNNAIVPILPEVIHIEAMENAVEDVTNNKSSTTIAKLIGCLRESWQQSLDERIKPKYEELSDYLSVNGIHRLEQFKSFDVELNTHLDAFFPGVNAHLDLPLPSIDDIFKNITIRLEEQNTPREVGQYGQGTQRCLQLALVKFLATQSSKALLTENHILMIDEPELYLHPHMVEIIRQALLTLSRNGFQIIITTHSPLLLNSEDTFKGAILVKKSNMQTIISNNPSSKLERIVKSHIEKFDLFENKGYALFAEKVLIVEGVTEGIILPTIFRMHFPDLAHKVAFIHVDGCQSILPVNQICEHFGLNVLVTADLDYCQNFQSDFSDDLNSLKALFDEAEILVAESGWPTSSSHEKASQAWARFACSYPKLIQELHDKFKDQKNIWLWKSGDIESALCIADDGKKSAKARDFIKNYKEADLDKYPQLQAWLTWVSDGV